jgi:kynurenine formamidase
MSGIRDLSQPVRTGMTVYPGDPAVEVVPALTLARDSVAVAALRLGSHTGTHVDAPAHIIPGGRTTGAIGLSELTGEALVVHLPNLAPRSAFGLDAIDAALARGLPDRLPGIVVLHTGWSRHFSTPLATEHPVLQVSAATELIRRGMHVLAVDTLSPDPTASGATDFPVHVAVLGSDKLIVENLTNLVGLPETVRVGFFPLAVDADGAPIRAVAFDID